MPRGNLPVDPESRGRLIASRFGWVQPSADPGTYFVRDIASGKRKIVSSHADGWTCSCADGHRPCEHIFAAQESKGPERQRQATLQFVVEEWNSPELQRAYRKGQEAEYQWFDPLLKSLLDMVPDPPRPPSRPGTRPTPLREALFLSVCKAHEGISLSRLKGQFQEAHNKGLLTKDWNYSLPARTLGRGDITPILIWAIRESAKPLIALEDGGTVAIDSTGFTTSVFGAYYPQAHDVTPRRQFIKVHAAVMTRTNIIADVRVTDSRSADSPQFIPLLRGTVECGFRPEYAVADKAYLGRENLQAAVDLGLKPRIPFKSNSNPAARGYRIWSSLYHLTQIDPDGFADAYHQRSNVEATFSAIKRLLGESVFSRRPAARLNEALCKVLCWNMVTLIRHFTARGIDLAPLFRSPPGDEPSSDETGANGIEHVSRESFEAVMKSSVGPRG